MDVGYILGVQSEYEELRYSLRSLVNFTPGVDQVWIAGAPLPDWAQNIRHIAVEQLYVEPDMAKRDVEWWIHRKLNMRRNIWALSSHPEVSATWLYMNDDFMLVQPTDATPLPHRGTIAAFADGDITKQEGPYPDIYRWFQTQGIPDPYFVSEHVPMVVDERLIPMMRDVWDIPGFPVASLWGNLTEVPLEGYGKIDGDWLLVKERFHQETWPPFWWSVSTVHRSFFEWPVGEKLRRMFPDPSPYEVT